MRFCCREAIGGGGGGGAKYYNIHTGSFRLSLLLLVDVPSSSSGAGGGMVQFSEPDTSGSKQMMLAAKPRKRLVELVRNSKWNEPAMRNWNHWNVILAYITHPCMVP